MRQVIRQQKTCAAMCRSLVSLRLRTAGGRAVSMLAAAALFMTLAQATTHAAETGRYLIDSGGNVVMSPTAGVCVQTSEWKPGTGVPPCDPEAAKKVAAPTPPPPAPAPKPAAAPAPKPVVAQAAPQKISFAADVLFEFNKATLKTSAVKPLDDVVQLLNNATFSAISVVGHTDRLGRAEYNKKLSQQRARAVADYLVSTVSRRTRCVRKAVARHNRRPVRGDAAACRGRK